MLAACLEKNALQNIGGIVIEPFSLQYHTPAEHVSSKSINSSYDILKFSWRSNIEVVILNIEHLLVLETFYQMKILDFTRVA